MARINDKVQRHFPDGFVLHNKSVDIPEQEGHLLLDSDNLLRISKSGNYEVIPSILNPVEGSYPSYNLQEKNWDSKVPGVRQVIAGEPLLVNDLCYLHTDVRVCTSSC